MSAKTGASLVVQLQVGGKGEFQETVLSVDPAGRISIRDRAGQLLRTAETASATASAPKSSRGAGHEIALRLDLSKPDSAGDMKHVFSVSSAAEMQQLQDELRSGTTDGHVPSPAAAPQEAQDGAFLTQMPKSEWARDDDHETCMLCSTAFTLFNRRHHCRRCGKCVCSDCAQHKMSFHYDSGIGADQAASIFQAPTQLERACNTCYAEGIALIQQRAGHVAAALAEVTAARAVLAAAEAQYEATARDSRSLVHCVEGHEVTSLNRGGYCCSVCNGWKCRNCETDNHHTSNTCMSCHKLKPRDTSTSPSARHVLDVCGLAGSTAPGSQAYWDTGGQDITA
jgi:hypothetical protein